MGEARRGGVHPIREGGEKTDVLGIDTGRVPFYARDILAAATLRYILDIRKRPNCRENMDARIAAKENSEKEGCK